jgi:nucleotide-binding universal stress UspA family protein
MSIATIMVHAGFDPAADDRIRLALGLAETCGATLIGVAAWAPRPPVATDNIVLDGELFERERQYIVQQLAAREATFRELARGAARACEWRSAVSLPNDFLARQARAADLVIVGSNGATVDAYRDPDVGGVVLKIGRPVIAVPAGATTLRAKRIMIAWKDAREARRAVLDALPLLRRADEIFVVTVCEEGDEALAKRSAEDVVTYLKRHEIETKFPVVLGNHGSAGEQLLHFAEDRLIDLVVAGGYGHTRLGEWVFGGATRTLLTQSPVCCLFSH